MNATLWILQIVLALVFAAHGWLLLAPPPDLIEAMNATMSTSFRLFLGVAEILAAIGLTMPGFTRIMPWLVPAAAAGVVIVMISATILHLVRAEWSSAVITFVLLLMATALAYLRWKVRPILPRLRAGTTS